MTLNYTIYLLKKEHVLKFKLCGVRVVLLLKSGSKEPRDINRYSNENLTVYFRTISSLISV